MKKRIHYQRLIKTLLWQEYRSSGWKMLLYPVGLGVFFVGIMISTAIEPSTLTPQTQQSIEQQLQLYYSGIENINNKLYAMAMFLIQGPYLLVVFSGVLGLRASNRMTSRLIDSGQFELLLSTPFDVRDIFLSLLASTILLTIGSVMILGVIAIGGPLIYLTANGVLLTGNLNTFALIAFLLPIPFALWSNVVIILKSIGIGGEWLRGGEDFLNLFGIAPGISLVFLITAYPRIDLVNLAVGSFITAIVVVALCLYWLTNSFTADRILPE